VVAPDYLEYDEEEGSEAEEDEDEEDEEEEDEEEEVIVWCSVQWVPFVARSD
jgi:hypothetical protein